MKKAIIITGYESSGSVFISKVISHALGKCKEFGDWHGYGQNGEHGDDLIILHRSTPSLRPKKWHEQPHEFHDLYPNYDISFVICTRDLNISQKSRLFRFGGNPSDYKNDSKKATEIFTKLLREEHCYIWSFESMVALGEIYFQLLYDWLDVEHDYLPAVKDANKPYIKLKFFYCLRGVVREKLRALGVFR